jgi:L-fuconolactonase
MSTPWRVDAHQHFWRVCRGDYFWMPDSGPLARDYLPRDLAGLNEAAGICGTVLVQAAPTVAETEYLLGLADADGPVDILGVVGWADLAGPDLGEFEKLASHPKLVGVRPMIQDIAADDWVIQPAVLDGLSRLPSLGLTFDLLCHPRHLRYAIQALEQVPQLPVVVDHLAKPRNDAVDSEWRAHMADLAARPGTYCKLAGLVTEVGRGWTAGQFAGHVEAILELFGPRRIMIGTDWPVLLTAAEHRDVVALSDRLISQLPAEDQVWMWRGAAKEFYRLDTEPGATST